MVPSNSLITSNALIPEEGKVLKMKYAGKRFGVMTDDERIFSAQTLLLKIYAITGWTLPVNEMMDIFVDQFEKKLSEQFAFTNTTEFEYAFRTRSLDIKDWGKVMNLSLIDEVMIPYLDSRKEISKIEESKSHHMQIEEKKELSMNEWDEWIKDAKTYPFEIIPTSIYDFLEKQGVINLTKDKKHQLMSRSIAYASSRLEGEEFTTFLKMKKDGVFSGHYLATLITLSKRFAVKDYFESENKHEPITQND